MKPTSDQDMQLLFLMTATQHLLRASFEGLETRWASLERAVFVYRKGKEERNKY